MKKVKSAFFDIFRIFGPFSKTVHRLRQREVLSQAIDELSEYTGRPRNMTRTLFYDEFLAQNAWKRTNPQSEEQIMGFYAREFACSFVDLRWNLLDPAKFRSRYKLLNFCQRNKVKSVLDFGAGVGEYSIFLAEKGYDVTYCDVGGVNWDFSAWRIQNRQLPVKMLKSDEDKLGLYDLVICVDVLEHVKNPLLTLKLLQHALKKNGFLCATFPFSCRKPQHLEENQRYALTIENDLKVLGFELVFEDYFRWYLKK